MAFEDVVFPTFPMIKGTSRQDIRPVRVVGNGTYEQRQTSTKFERYLWSIPAQSMKVTQRESIREFLVQRNHALNSFKFVDPLMPELDEAVMSHNSTSYWNLAIPFSSTVPGTHPIFNPTIAGLTVTVDGIPDTIDSFTLIDGYPVIQILGTTGSEVVKVSGPLHFTVRLNNEMQAAILALDSYNKTNDAYLLAVSDIQLVEVFGEV